jgi:hypothetical protein
MKRIFCLFVLGFALTSFGAGCNEQETPIGVETPKKASMISTSETLVSPDEAGSAKDEPVPNIQGAMPCLQFKHSQGLLKWLSDYETRESENAIKMAERIHLPDVPDSDFLTVFKASQTQESLQTSLCNIHQELQIFTWAVEFAEKTIVYTYRKPNFESLDVDISARTQEAIEENANTLEAGLPVCLPKTITDTELIWFCGTPYETWKEVHVNRKMGNMVQLLCEPNETGKPGAGCLDPTGGQ